MAYFNVSCQQAGSVTRVSVPCQLAGRVGHLSVPCQLTLRSANLSVSCQQTGRVTHCSVRQPAGRKAGSLKWHVNVLNVRHRT